MKRELVTIVAATVCCAQAHALDIEAVRAKPTADSPRHDDEQAWPMLVGDEYFLKQKWPEAKRLLIWGLVDENGGSASGDPRIAAHWIDAATGKPAATPPDMDTDVILPDSDRPYRVQVARGAQVFACRHLTLGRNVVFKPTAGGSLAVFGNLWIRPGAEMHVYRTLSFVGGADTFFRQDWPEDGKLRRLHDERTPLPYDPDETRDTAPWWAGNVTRYFGHDKPGGTTEVIGYFKTGDEVRINAGTFIVGRDSRFLCGGISTAAIGNGATLALMDGAMHGHACNQSECDCVVAEGGAITAGTPDRPIQRDAHVGVGFRNWMNMAFPDQPDGPRAGTSAYGALSGSFSGKLAAYPAPSSDAKLVVCWQRISFGGFGRGTKVTPAFKQAFAKLPPKITIWLGQNAQVENVRFEDLHRGGIVLPDASAAEQWKNVTYGDGCLSQNPGELLREYEGKVLRGRPAERLEPLEKYTKP